MGGPFTYELRVPWGDVDLSTTIYYPRLFHYFETAIEELFRSRGLEYGKFARTGAMLARVAASAEYKAPIHIHDPLTISVRVARVGRTSVTFALEALKEGRAVARGTSTGVAVRWGEWKSVEVPQALREILGPPEEGGALPEPRSLPDPPAGAHRWRTRVHAGDVDLAQIIYYPTLFHLFEQSIEELFLAMGAPYRGRTTDLSLTFPRVSVRGEFLTPIRAGDLLTFDVGVGRVGTTSLTFLSRAKNQGDATVARAEVTSVAVDKSKWKPVPVPSTLRDAVRPFT